MLLVLSFLYLKTSYVFAEEIIVEKGAVETVYDWSSQKCEAKRDLPDAVAKAFIDDQGNVQIIAADTTGRRNIGPNLDDIQHSCAVIMSSHNNPDPRAYDDYEWLMSPYTLDGKNIFALVHTEYHGWEAGRTCNATTNRNFNCWWNSINLATSTNSGATYTHLDFPNQNVANTPIDYNPDNTSGHIGYFEPSSIIKKDNYYYSIVYAHNPPDSRRPCLMRTSNLTNPASWYFWKNGNFNTPARGGTCDTLNGRPPHTSLGYNAYLEKYIAEECYPENGCTYATSTDLLNWSPRKSLLQSRELDVYAYGGLLQPGDPTRNFEQSGRSPWFYFTACANNCSVIDFDLKRVRLRFSKPEDVGKYQILDLQMNEKKGGKTLDSSFYGSNGSLSGASFHEEGTINYLNFSGAAKIEVSHQPNLNASGKLTIEVKVRTTVNPSKGNFASIIRKESTVEKRNYGLYITNGGKLHFSVGGTGSVSTKSINDGQWHLITVIYDDETKKAGYFIDNQPDIAVTHTKTLAETANSANVFIGDQGFIGDIDFLTIFNYNKRSFSEFTASTYCKAETFTINSSGADHVIGGNVKFSFNVSAPEGQKLTELYVKAAPLNNLPSNAVANMLPVVSPSTAYLGCSGQDSCQITNQSWQIPDNANIRAVLGQPMKVWLVVKTDTGGSCSDKGTEGLIPCWCGTKEITINASSNQSGTLNFQVKFQSISAQKPNQTIGLTLKQAGVEKYRFNNLAVTGGATGIYSGSVTGISPGTYDVFVKGWAHLQKKFTGVNIVTGANSQNWSAVTLPAGDFNDDNKLNVTDFALILAKYTDLSVPVTAQNAIFDVDLSNDINISDIALALNNYTQLEVSGEF